MNWFRHIHTWFFIGCALVGRAVAQEDSPLKSLADVRAITRAEAVKRPAVRVRGVVSLLGEGLASSGRVAPALSSFCIEEQTNGIWVTVSQALREGFWEGDEATLLALQEGTEIELDGVLVEGAFAPNILPRRLKALGQKPLLPALDVPLARLMSGAEDVHRVRVTGVVQSIADESGTRWLLKVQTGLGHFLARLPKLDSLTPTRLLDAEVRMSGLAAVSRNWRSEFVCPRLIVSHEKDIEILQAPPADPFAALKVPLHALDAFSPDGRPLHRRRIEGVVTYTEPGEFMVIQEGTAAVRIEPGAENLKVGDRVEAAGFIDTSREMAGMSGAQVRVIKHEPTPPPVSVSMTEIQDDYHQLRSGKPTRLPGGYDHLLVSVTGHVLSVQGPSQEGVQRLELDCGDSVTTAFVRDSLQDLQPGTKLCATGIAIMQYAPAGQTANFARPTRLDLLVRDRHDIAVLSAPSWWTIRRMLAALFCAAAIALGALAWASVLRRTVARQTQLLAQEMRGRRDAAVEFQAALRERSRLAANLHDTVLQTMTGIAYQIEACETESLPEAERKANHLETARRMVQRGQEDLRNSVWALRALPMKERTFTEAVRSVTQQISAGHEVEIIVEPANELPVPADFIAGNLLLIVQEAVHNALKHAKPKQIRISLSSSADDASFVIVVQDDGAGFVLGSQPGANEGHFGLDGMRERAERLGGTLELKSTPGSGTCLRIEVPLRSFDHDLV